MAGHVPVTYHVFTHGPDLNAALGAALVVFQKRHGRAPVAAWVNEAAGPVAAVDGVPVRYDGRIPRGYLYLELSGDAEVTTLRLG